MSKQSDEEGKLKDELQARKKEKRKMEKQFKEKGEKNMKWRELKRQINMGKRIRTIKMGRIIKEMCVGQTKT